MGKIATINSQTNYRNNLKVVPFKNYTNGFVLIPNADVFYIFVLKNQFSSVMESEFGTFILRNLPMCMIK